MTRLAAEVVGPRELRRRRRAAKGRRRLRRVITWTVVLASLITGGIMLVHSSLFAVNGIQVSGTKVLTAQEVVSASGLRLGMNVLSVDAKSVTARLKQLPLIAGVHVQRVYPSKVRIVVRERTPAGVALTTSGPLLLSPAGGVITAAATMPAGLPVIRVLGVSGSDGLSEGLRLWGQLPDWARAKTIWINALDPTKLATTYAGSRVIFGTADEVPQKLIALNAVFDRARVGGRRVLTLDLRAPSRPAAVLA